MGEFDHAQRLIELLGSTPKHPWPALIPQVLVWCFRRFCIEKIISSGGNLVDSLWDDHLELVHMYCPKGLEAASTEWFTPENIETLYSPLDEYNGYFVDFVNELDYVIKKGDYQRQDVLSGFLDSTVCDIFKEWLQDTPFIIFPMSPEKEDEFTDFQFKGLIRALMEHASKSLDQEPPQPVEEPPQPVEEPPQPPLKEYYRVLPPSLLWHFVTPPLMPESLRPYEPKPSIFEQPISSVPAHVVPNGEPVISSVTNAIAHRRTMRRRCHHNSRGKTRRSQAAA